MPSVNVLNPLYILQCSFKHHFLLFTCLFWSLKIKFVVTQHAHYCLKVLILNVFDISLFKVGLGGSPFVVCLSIVFLNAFDLMV